MYVFLTELYCPLLLSSLKGLTLERLQTRGPPPPLQGGQVGARGYMCSIGTCYVIRKFCSILKHFIWGFEKELFHDLVTAWLR